MARKVKRWAVRADYDGSPYMLFLGDKPRKPKGGWSQSQAGYYAGVGKRMFEGFFPKCYHLNRGGLVEIRFEESPA